MVGYLHFARPAAAAPRAPVLARLLLAECAGQLVADGPPPPARAPALARRLQPPAGHTSLGRVLRAFSRAALGQARGRPGAGNAKGFRRSTLPAGHGRCVNCRIGS